MAQLSGAARMQSPPCFHTALTGVPIVHARDEVLECKYVIFCSCLVEMEVADLIKVHNCIQR